MPEMEEMISEKKLRLLGSSGSSKTAGQIQQHIQIQFPRQNQQQRSHRLSSKTKYIEKKTKE